MVCVLEESEAQAVCVVKDPNNSASTVTLTVNVSQPVSNFVRQVATSLNYDPQEIELYPANSPDSSIVLKVSSEETLQAAGIKTDNSRNLLVVQHVQSSARRRVKVKTTGGFARSGVNQNLATDLESTAESTSPTTTSGDYPTYNMPAPNNFLSNRTQEYPYYAGLIKQDTGYVGLVNQAMTCYLNSLLQALYMTPEFRNALYKWQYDQAEDQIPAKCIPYQLQRLFLNLQTSRKTAVETTELTKSFGWDSSEAWQQHDIQELCRVMFDALETVFKGTNQADLIDRLYQGKMIDYVKCLECTKEKSREDTFLDIPLPVRPFGSAVAYSSVEEALRAFVQPETLDGANQYFCESCGKKCDAHKGLKFTKFPYLLTLHLKRFDFDYSTLHRIKLNDKVAFPELLDLNSFVEQAQTVEKEEGSEGIPDELTVSKCDDSSTTDSGSALDDEACQPVDLPTSQDINQDDDEGIDVSGGNGSNHHENEKNRRHGLPKGPYVYELFSIMIHSGSASGGHYYAYIKDFSNGEWFCFNDTSVTRITTDDIAKTYGGGSVRGYYSGAYSSSTNAYMLMYRQINESINCPAIKVEEFPDHIKALYEELQEKYEVDRKFQEKQHEMIKIKVYCQHPTKGMTDTKVYVHNDSTLSEVTSSAYTALKLSDLVDESDCRIVAYNASQENIEVSFDGQDKELFSELTANLQHADMLLEFKDKEDTFQVYQHGGVTIRIHTVDLETEEVTEPAVLLRCQLASTVGELKASIAALASVKVPADNMVIVLEKNHPSDYHLLDNDETTLSDAWFYSSNKVYISKGPLETPFQKSKLNTLIDRFQNVITLHLTFPDTDPDTLARMSIPSLSAVQAAAAAAAKPSGDASLPPLEKVSVAADHQCNARVGKNTAGSSRGLMLPLILTGGGGGDEEKEDASYKENWTGGQSDQSTSEDSSLTDSDRTLIGDVQDEFLSEGDNQLVSPPEEEPNPLPAPESPVAGDGDNVCGTCACADTEKREIPELQLWDQEEENWDDESANKAAPKQVNYFKIYPEDSDLRRRVQVDKRMGMDALKTCLEPHLGVPASCFKLYGPMPPDAQAQKSLRNNNHCDNLNCLKSGDHLVIKLGRQLTNDEHKIKVHQFVLNSSQPAKFLFEWIVAKGQCIGQTKKEIVDDLNKRNGSNLQYDRCRLRKKNWKNVGRVYLDSQKWVDDVTVYSNGDVFFQELSEPEPITSTKQFSLFVRHWHPASLTLDPFEELVLDSFSIDELREKLSQKTGIPVENVDFAKAPGYFPCEMSVLKIHTELDWNPKAVSLESYPIQISEDGGVVFYRDNREELKPLTEEERTELSTKETARLAGSSGTVSTYSPRKERPLKIYLDRKPVEADVD